MNVDNLSLNVTEALLRTQTAKDRHADAERSRRAHCAVAISREVGALGETAAREVGRRLGCPVYDREIVEKIATELHRTPSQLQPLDERSTGWVEDWVGGLFREPLVSADTYFRYLAATIRGMAEIGPCVIVGRGAPRILAAESTLRVRFVADLADRVQVVQKRRHLSEHEAAAWISRTEHERAEFVKRNFGVDPADPHQYDLVVNTSRLAVDEAAEFIAYAFGQLLRRAGHKRGIARSEPDA